MGFSGINKIKKNNGLAINFNRHIKCMAFIAIITITEQSLSHSIMEDDVKAK